MQDSVLENEVHAPLAGLEDEMAAISGQQLRLARIAGVGEEHVAPAAGVGRHVAHVQDEVRKFLEEDAKKPGVVTTASGLQYEVVKKADGPQPKPTDVVTVHYEGKLIDGKVFDSSVERGSPIDLPVSEAGQTAVELALRRLQNPEEREVRTLSTLLLVRESTAPPSNG